MDVQYRLRQLGRALQRALRRSPNSWVRSRVAAEDWSALCSAVAADAPRGDPYSVAYEDYYERRNLALGALRQAGHKAFAALTAALEKEADSELAYLLVQLDDPSSYPLIRKHFDAKRFVGSEHNFTRYLGKHGVDPVQEKQSHCSHRWRRAHTTERMDICDDCGLYWYYVDGRGDAIPDAEVSRPVMGLTRPAGKSPESERPSVSAQGMSSINRETETCPDCGRAFPRGALLDVFVERGGTTSRRLLCRECGLKATEGFHRMTVGAGAESESQATAALCVHCGTAPTGRSTELYDSTMGVIRVACERCDERIKDEFHRRAAGGEGLTMAELESAVFKEYSADQLARAVIRRALCVHCGKPSSGPGGDTIWYAGMKASLIQCGTCLSAIKARPDYTGTAYEQALIASYPAEQRLSAVRRFR